MRYILLILYIAFQSTQAQTPPVLKYKTFADDISATNDIEKGDYYRDTNNVLDRYVGTWQYQQRNTTFILKIRRVNQFLTQAPNADFYIYQDILLVNYKLIKNGIILVDELNQPIVYNLTESNRYSEYSRYNPAEGMYGTFVDLTHNISVDSDIKRL